MITLTSPIPEFTAAAQSQGACQEAIDWLNSHHGTVDQGIDAFLAEDTPEAYAVFTLAQLNPYVSEDVLARFAVKISDPMMAYTLDRMLNLPSVSAILRPVYEGQICL